MGKKTVPFLIALFVTACATNTPVPTATPAPSETSVPTETVTHSLISSQAITKNDLPLWLGNTQDTIFATITEANDNGFILTFFNASTNQDFNLQLEDVHGYFWLPDGKRFGFLLKDHQTLLVMNLDTGDVSELSESEWEVTSAIDQLSDEIPFPYTVIESPLANERYFLNHPYFISGFSDDDRYWTYSDGALPQIGDPAYEIQEIASGEKILLGAAEDGWENRWSDWAPVGQMNAFLEFDEPFSIGNAIILGKRIMIYEASTGELWRSHSGLFGWPHWAPDGEHILYADINILEDGYYAYANIPCILDVDDGNKNCLAAIPDQHPAASTLTNFQWYRDSENISYIVSELSDAPALAPSHFCIFNIPNETVACPSDSYRELNHLHITSYQISPNGDFGILAIGESHYDEWSSSTSVLIGLHSEIYKLLGPENSESAYVQFPYGSILWRP